MEQLNTAAADAAELRRRSITGLNGLNFFVADMMTGFGPFVTVYLIANGWQPTDIGVALGTGSIAAMAGQIPGGMLVDALTHRRRVAAAGIAVIILASLCLALFPSRLPVLTAELLQGLAISVLVPAIAAMTLSLSRSDKLAERLGGNVRFKALGSMLAALLMGYVGTQIAAGAVFYVAAAFGLAALGCLLTISRVDIANSPARTEHPSVWPKRARREPLRRRRELWRDPMLLTFGGCIFMFHLSNAAVLPFAIAAIQSAGLKDVDLLVSIALVVSQGVAALISPRLGIAAQARGRKRIVLLGFAALALRCVLFAIYSGPIGLVLYQVLDGVSAAAIGIMVPLIVSDITHRGGRFNLAMGLIGMTVSFGAAVSTTTAGFVAEHFGTRPAFVCLAVAAAAGCLLAHYVLPETGPRRPAA